MNDETSSDRGEANGATLYEFSWDLESCNQVTAVVVVLRSTVLVREHYDLGVVRSERIQIGLDDAMFLNLDTLEGKLICETTFTVERRD